MTRPLVLLLSVFLVPACNCGQVASEDEARVAYAGMDDVVTKALALGFAGFNSASSANIAPQSAAGDLTGTIDVTGQVDQGSSDNKGMRLQVALVDYSDGLIDDPETEDVEELDIHYDTAGGAPLDLDLSLRDIPDGTLTGTLVGNIVMGGDLGGELDVNISLSGEIQSDGAAGTERVGGSTDVTGTATGPNGTFDIDTQI